MATITLTVTTAHLTRIVDAISTRYGYSSTLPDGTSNPQTKGEFARLRVGQWIRDTVLEHEGNTARAAVSVTPVDIT